MMHYNYFVYGKQKSVTVQCKAQRYYESPSRQLKNESDFFFSALRAEKSALHTSIHYLWQWPYHSKIPRAGTGVCVTLMYVATPVHGHV